MADKEGAEAEAAAPAAPAAEAPLVVCHVGLTHEKLSVEKLCDLVTHESCGAISTFLGTTRDNFEDKKVVRLEYEAYVPMAEAKMREIAEDAARRFGIYGVAMEHRLGLVPVKESSIIIAVSSPHRQAALEGCAFCINELKAKVPVWKKEVYDGEDPRWKENKEWKEAREAAAAGHGVEPPAKKQKTAAEAEEKA